MYSPSDLPPFASSRNKVVIIKYNAGNIQSVLYALERIGVEAVVSDDHAVIQSAKKVIFPGVGEASSAMRSLQAAGLDQLIPTLIQPVLGICVGMQLLCSFSEENETPCLGIFEEKVQIFQPNEVHPVKVPQIGWNTITHLRSPLMNGVPENSYCYFVHSYFVADNPYSIATAHYTQPYCAAFQKDNFFGVQFHVEKSAALGERMLQNFIELT